MTLMWGDTGRMAYGALKSYTIQLNPVENMISPTISVPTSSPATAQISFAISSAMLPTISPSGTCDYLPGIYVAGQNLSGSSVTINYEILKNGSSYKTGSKTSVANNSYWTLSECEDLTVKLGDVYDVKIWASVAGVNIGYNAILIYPRRLSFSEKGVLLKDVVYTISNTSMPVATGQGTSATISNTYWWVFVTDSNNINNGYIALNGAGSYKFPTLMSNDTFKMGTTQLGEIAFKTTLDTSTTSFPYLRTNLYPSQISLREIWW